MKSYLSRSNCCVRGRFVNYKTHLEPLIGTVCKPLLRHYGYVYAQTSARLRPRVKIVYRFWEEMHFVRICGVKSEVNPGGFEPKWKTKRSR